MVKFSARVALSSAVADHMPPFLRHAAVWWLLKRYRLHERMTQILGPIFDERRGKRKLLGDDKWNAVKPNDAVQWLLDAVEGKPKQLQSNEHLTLRVMALNLAAVLSTASVSRIQGHM